MNRRDFFKNLAALPLLGVVAGPLTKLAGDIPAVVLDMPPSYFGVTGWTLTSNGLEESYGMIDTSQWVRQCWKITDTLTGYELMDGTKFEMGITADGRHLGRFGEELTFSREYAPDYQI